MSQQPWTIESICTALGNPALTTRFVGEINKAPAHQILTVFAKWERIAKDTVAAVGRGQHILTAIEQGNEIPGEWIDGTNRLQVIASRKHHQGAA